MTDNFNIEGTIVLQRNLDEKKKLVLNRGGARSSKSYSISQTLCLKFRNERKKKILVIRKTHKSLTISTQPVIEKILADWDMLKYCRVNKSQGSIWFRSNFMHFSGLDDPEKMKSTDWNYIFVEEANEFTYDDIVMLELRLSAPTVSSQPNQMFLAFNPMDDNLYTKQLETRDDCEVIISSYKDNLYLSEDYITSIERLKDADSYLWKIYGCGEYATPQGVVHSNWLIDDQTYTAQYAKWYAVDFGTNEPAVLTEFLQLSQTDIRANALLYRTGLNHRELIAAIKGEIGNHNHLPIYCDSAEPDRIDEMRQAGLNAIKATKRVKDGIDYVNRYRLHIPSACVDGIKELKSFCYKKDRNGKLTDEVVEYNDHFVSTLRYGIHTHLFSNIKPAETSIQDLMKHDKQAAKKYNLIIRANQNDYSRMIEPRRESVLK